MWSGRIQSSFSVHVAWLKLKAQLMVIRSKFVHGYGRRQAHAACKDRDTPSERKGSRRNCEGAPETADTHLTKAAHSQVLINALVLTGLATFRVVGHSEVILG